MANATLDDLEKHAATVAAMASAILLGLAQGKYDGQVAATEEALRALGVIFPPAREAEAALEIFLALNKATAPSAAVPDGRGGFVPSDNPRIDPKTGQFVPRILRAASLTRPEKA